MQVQFLGATGTVTGSKYLVRSGPDNLLVDCGLFQGYKQLRLRNRAPLPVAPSAVSAVVLTHAHLDHSGYIPLLVRDGFRGRIYCSEATFDLCKLLLPDSGRLLEEEANLANRGHYSKHSPALPLYTEEDALRALKHFHPVPFGKRIAVTSRLHASLTHAGHILGASSVRVDNGTTSICFSGDLGRADDPVMVAPEDPQAADYLVVESTYGNRRHDPADPLDLLAKTIQETAARGGVVIVPSFAVGRAQSLLYYIQQLKEQGRIPEVLPVYLNSPMAADVTELYRKHASGHRLKPDQCRAMCTAAKIVNSPEESKALNRRHMPMVIIAASGMATGGRVLHHLKAFAPDPRNTVLFAGFQAGGTRGAAMLSGVDAIKIYGEYVPVRAQVEQIENLSAHADAGELLDWMRRMPVPPRRVFVTHGEPDAADTLRRRITDELGWDCVVPEYLDSVELD